MGKMKDKLKELVNPGSTTESLKIPTEDVVKDEVTSQVSKEEQEKLAAVQAELFGGPYTLETIQYNPSFGQLTELNLLYRLVKQMEALNERIDKIEKELSA